MFLSVHLVPAEDTPPDMVAFQTQLVSHINQQRPKWSQAQRDALAAFAVSYLQQVAPNKLTPGNLAVIAEYFADNLNRMGTVGSPDELTVQYNREFLRWEIDRFGARTEMVSSEKSGLEASISNCFAKAKEKLHAWTPAETHQQLDEIVMVQMKKTIRALHDPLYPGLKHPMSPDEFTECFEIFCGDFQRSVSAKDTAEIHAKCHTMNPQRVVNRCDVALSGLRISIWLPGPYDEQLTKVSTALGEAHTRKHRQLIEDVNSAAKSNDFDTARRVIDNHRKGSNSQ
jgi:hypothetical protein